MYIYNYIYIHTWNTKMGYLYIIRVYIYMQVCVYIHTLHYITLPYITLHYITHTHIYIYVRNINHFSTGSQHIQAGSRTWLRCNVLQAGGRSQMTLTWKSLLQISCCGDRTPWSRRPRRWDRKEDGSANRNPKNKCFCFSPPAG